MKPANAEFRILLVEDNPADVNLMRLALDECGFNAALDVVQDGEKAVDWFFGHEFPPRLPDLVILDLNLPNLSGHDVLDAIKSDDRTSAIPVIIMSASGSHRDVDRAFGLQANSYVKKPHTFDALLDVVAAIKNIWLTADKRRTEPQG